MIINKLAYYGELMKVRVLLLMVTTSWVGMCLAPCPFPSFYRWLGISVGIFFIAGAGAVMNHFFDRKSDAQMHRTQKRPLVLERVSLYESLLLISILFAVGSGFLVCYANLLTLVLTLLGSLGYCFIYTLLLKHSTPQNITIGGLYGSLPPLLGWVALTNKMTADAWLLVAIIFTWTPPHFWDLALDRQDEYKAASIPMLPVTHGHDFTSIAMILYTVLLYPVCIFPYLTGLFTYRYLWVSIFLNTIYLYLNINVFLKKNGANRKSFIYSINYLYLLFMTMVLDHWIA
jgi:heme o synthase